MKKLAIALAICSTFFVAFTAIPAQAQSWRWDECRYRSLYGSPTSFSHREMVKTARCVEGHFPVAGGFAKVDSVIDCESGWGPKAVSPTGEYRGLMQLGSGEFSTNLGPPRFKHYANNVFNPRSNLLAGIRMAHSVGWGPWTCA